MAFAAREAVGAFGAILSIVHVACLATNALSLRWMFSLAFLLLLGLSDPFSLGESVALCLSNTSSAVSIQSIISNNPAPSCVAACFSIVSQADFVHVLCICFQNLDLPSLPLTVAASLSFK